MSELETTQKTLDWERASAVAHVLLVAGAPETARRLRNGKLDPGAYWAEPIQSAALRAIDRDRSGVEALPATTDELAVVLARHARHINDNRRARIRRQARLMEADAERRRGNPEACRTRDFLREVIARDLFKKFVARLFDELDLDARRLLEAWLGEGVEFSDSQALMERLGISDIRTVHNIKRRIRFKARSILDALTGDSDVGESK